MERIRPRLRDGLTMVRRTVRTPRYSYWSLLEFATGITDGV